MQESSDSAHCMSTGPGAGGNSQNSRHPSAFGVFSRHKRLCAARDEISFAIIVTKAAIHSSRNSLRIEIRLRLKGGWGMYQIRWCMYHKSLRVTYKDAHRLLNRLCYLPALLFHRS